MMQQYMALESAITMLNLGERIENTLNSRGLSAIANLVTMTTHELYAIPDLSTIDIIKIRRSLMLVGHNLDESPVERVDHWLNAKTYPEFKGRSRPSHIQHVKHIEGITINLDTCGHHSILGAVMDSLINLPYRPKRFVVAIKQVVPGFDVARELQRARYTLGTEVFIIDAVYNGEYVKV